MQRNRMTRPPLSQPSITAVGLTRSSRWPKRSCFLLLEVGLPFNDNGDPSGAQTERRDGAGPVRSLLGGKGLTGRLLDSANRERPSARMPHRLPRSRHRSGLCASLDHAARLQPRFEQLVGQRMGGVRLTAAGRRGSRAVRR
jgi:hypothetical protein